MRYIFVDPSGSFNEGKGHTGIAVIDDWDWNTLQIKSIDAKKFDTRLEYWRFIITTVHILCKNPMNTRVIIESFVVRANGFTLGKMPETIMLIGALVYKLENYNIKYTFQTPSQAKTRFKDEYLGRYIPKYERRDNGFYYLDGKRINDHIRDALKHLLYYMKYGKEA